MTTYTIYIGVRDEEMVSPVIEHIKHLNFKVFIGNKVNSFSQLVNNCLIDCESDIMIFCSHKVRPTENDIIRLVNKIYQGYGYVGLYRFACFAIHKTVIKKIGYFDEKFRAGYEDDDFRVRLNYANIGFYEDHSVKYIVSGTTWTNDRKIEESYFHTKYTIDEKNKTIKINIPLAIDNSIDTSKFLTHSDSVYVKNINSYYGKLGPGIHDFTFI